MVVAGAGQQEAQVFVKEGSPRGPVAGSCFKQRFYFKNPMAA